MHITTPLLPYRCYDCPISYPLYYWYSLGYP